MTFDRYRAGDLTLALMYITLHDEFRVWKGYSWDVLDHLFQQGLITDPRSKAKSIILTEEGLARSHALFQEHLATPGPRLPITGQDARLRNTPPATPSKGSLTEFQLAEATKLLTPSAARRRIQRYGRNYASTIAWRAEPSSSLRAGLVSANRRSGETIQWQSSAM